MEDDEMEWVRDVVDAWLCANGPTLAVVFALMLALASLLPPN